MIDLEQLRRTVASREDPEAVVTVSRRFLEQVDLELTSGRAAQAKLAVSTAREGGMSSHG